MLQYLTRVSRCCTANPILVRPKPSQARRAGPVYFSAHDIAFTTFLPSLHSTAAARCATPQVYTATTLVDLAAVSAYLLILLLPRHPQTSASHTRRRNPASQVATVTSLVGLVATSAYQLAFTRPRWGPLVAQRMAERGLDWPPVVRLYALFGGGSTL